MVSLSDGGSTPPPPAKEGRPEWEGFAVYGRPIFTAEIQAVELIEVVEELETLKRRLLPEEEDDLSEEGSGFSSGQRGGDLNIIKVRDGAVHGGSP